MGALRAAALSAILTGLSGLSVDAAPFTDADLRRAPVASTPLPPIGLQLDAGLPDGAMAAVTLRPVPYTRFHLGAGTNTASPGLRGGLTILPVGEGPSLNLEVGHYLAGESNVLVRSLISGLGDFSSYVRRLSYTFVNAHAGLDLGRRNFTFFVHGGFTYLRAGLHDLNVPIDADPARPGRTTFTFNKDPQLRLLLPSVKLGLITYFQ